MNTSMSPSPATRPPTVDDFVLLGTKDLSETASGVDWLWQGFLAPGNVTVLSSQWKSGKTTLVSALLSKLKAGGTFVGQSVRPGKSIIISEESATLWHQRHRAFDFGPDVGWICRPFRGKPTPEQWSRLIDRIAAWHAEQPRDLVVIDPLAPFLPGDENVAAAMLDALLPLQRLTAAGLAVLVLHHSRKNVQRDGQAARGSGALSSYADILIEMFWFRRAADDDRRRRLQAYSRHAQTPRQLVIELNAAGTDFDLVGNEVEATFADTWKLLHAALADAENKMSREEIRESWPEDGETPDMVSLWRWLNRAVDAGLVLRDGKGLKNEPYQYWLPDSEERWKTDPLHLPDLPPIRQQFANLRNLTPKQQSELDEQIDKEAAIVREKLGKKVTGKGGVTSVGPNFARR